MRCNVDEKCRNDPRFRRLARTMGWHVDWCIGAATTLWIASLNRVDHDNPMGLMSRDDAEDSTDHRELVAAMLSCGLAEEVDGMVYFKGTEERAEFLLRQRARGKRGGEKKAANETGNEASQKLAPACGNPSAGLWEDEPRLVGNVAPACGNASQLSFSGSGSDSGSVSGSGSGSTTSGSAEASPMPAPLKRVTDHFQARYVERTGSKPTWGGDRIKLLKPLIHQHGADEVCRRIDVLFLRPPKFLADSTPDVRSLSANFDKLAEAVRQEETPRWAR